MVTIIPSSYRLRATGPNGSVPACRSQLQALSRGAAALPEWPHRDKAETPADEITAKGGEGSDAQVDARDERTVAEYIRFRRQPALR
jgi:hypothetical protein